MVPYSVFVDRFIALFLLLYPSIPYFSLGWGTNIPFFVVAVLFNCYALFIKGTFKFEKNLLLYLWSIPVATIATVIMYYQFGSMNLTVPLIGLRELVTEFTILSAIYTITRMYDLPFVTRGLFLGVLANLCYGFIETVYPEFKLSAPDLLFHEMGKNDLYLLKEEAARIRLFWPEPSQASTYLILTLPMLFLCSGTARKALFFLAWLAVFLKVASKGTLIFFPLAVVPFMILRPGAVITFCIKKWWVGVALAFLSLIFVELFDSELVEEATYVSLILQTVFDPSLYTFDLNEFYERLRTSNIGESQYIRLVNFLVTVHGFIREPYAFITGFSPLGMKYFYYLNPDIVPEGMRISSVLDKYTTEDLHLAKHYVQSSFLDVYVSYGVLMFIFMMRMFIGTYRNLSTLFFDHRNKILLYTIWIFLVLMFMRTTNIAPILFVAYLWSEKLLHHPTHTKTQ